MDDAGFRIRPAGLDDLDGLAAVERGAASRFREAGLRGAYLDEAIPRSALVEAAGEGRLWVAVPTPPARSTLVPDAEAVAPTRGPATRAGVGSEGDVAGTVVGFALGDRLDDGTPLLEEVDVLPAFGRRGIGAALVKAVAAWARRSGAEVLVLRTFADLPWNAPMYARLGFVVVAEDAASAAERRLRDEEARRGLPVDRRVTMRLALGEGEGSCADQPHSKR